MPLEKIIHKISDFFKFEHRLWPPNKEGAKELGKKAFYLLGVLAIFILLLFAWYAKDLPTPDKIKNLKFAGAMQILDRNGKTLYGASGTQNRNVIESQDIPQNIKEASVAVEDKNFYKEYLGISPTGIIRAAINNILHLHISQGGSTITQQLAKNTILNPKRTFSRKIKEVILAIELEVMYNKNQILTMYLNAIPYGSNAYGIDAASNTYFNKSAKDLTLAEAAYLAAIPQAPTYYSPYGTHRNELDTRKNYVLDRMVAERYITKEEADKAKTEQVTFAKYHENIKAPHFVMYIKDQLVEMYGEQMVQNGGLKITTTLDLDLQGKAQEAMDENKDKVFARGGTNAALVAIDPKTGQILSMLGSFDYFDDAHDGQVNVANSERQPGSSFKPVVYATAFKNEKYNPAYPLYDLKTDFGGGYTPENYNRAFFGPMTIRNALAQSRNVPAVKTLYLAGMDNTLKTAKSMGITTLTDPKRYGLSLVLGGGEVKLLELTEAYTVFADEGKLAPTTPFLKIEDSGGKTIYEYKERKENVLDPQIAYEISDILSDNGARAPVFGAIPYMTLPGRKAAIKTGTTQNFHDGWTIGYTPSLVAGVWTGNNDNSAMKQGADGSMVAAPIWQSFMKKALEGKPAEDFNRPAEIKNVSVDFLSNKLPTENSTDVISEIFATWQVPKQRDNVHVKYKICKLDGKLATDLTPADQIEEKVFADIHSEVPSLPNWEGPVRAWAAAQGLLNPPPKETTDIFVGGNAPTISITGPANGASVSGTFIISAAPISKYGMARVDFYIDNVLVGNDDTSPYAISYNAGLLSVGSHNLTATVHDKMGMTATDKSDFKVAADTSAPVISGISVTALNSTSATIIWTTNEDANSVLEYGINPSLGQSKTSSVMTISHSIGLTGLVPNTTYYYKVKSTDASGNTGSSPTLSFTTPS